MFDGEYEQGLPARGSCAITHALGHGAEWGLEDHPAEAVCARNTISLFKSRWKMAFRPARGTRPSSARPMHQAAGCCWLTPCVLAQPPVPTAPPTPPPVSPPNMHAARVTTIRAQAARMSAQVSRRSCLCCPSNATLAAAAHNTIMWGPNPLLYIWQPPTPPQEQPCTCWRAQLMPCPCCATRAAR